MDFDPIPFDFRYRILIWLQVTGTVIAAGLALGLLVSVLRNGPRGVRLFLQGLKSYVEDIGSLSPRRVLALMGLTFREALRNRALLVFVLFAIMLMFGGWFVSDANERADLQVKPTIAFILTTISWLTLPVIMFLSCWAIPEDIRVRSLHTVVTKPVRRLEIVLGRIAGFWGIALLVLSVMGVTGYFWIVRQVPASAQSQLTCRVPVFGHLYFLSPDGEPTRKGINVGDVWEHRSHIMGNSRARAVWLFADVTPDRIGDQLELESRFEAFRTVKGTADSAKFGLEAQYTLVRNPREEAFGTLALGVSLRALADALRDGQFRSAADAMEALAQTIRTDWQELPLPDYAGLYQGALTADVVLKTYDESLTPLGDLFADVGIAAQQLLKADDAIRPVAQEELADKFDVLAEFVRENYAELQDKLPRLEVPLESFHISEYHEGDRTTITRTIRFAADSESLARFLTRHVSEWNDDGKLAEGSSLKAGLATEFEQSGLISVLNAELLAAVLQEQVTEGALTVSNGTVTVADGGQWFEFFDDLVRRELLASQDSEGWLIDVDLFDDLTINGTLRIEVACLNDQMYLGMARPDLFIRLQDQSFLTGYSKAVVTIGLMLMLVITLAVTASCIVKGPVAFLFAVSVFVVGQFFHGFMLRIVTGQEVGLVESATLMLQHRNPSAGMNASETAQGVIRNIDSVSTGLLHVASYIVPNFNVFGRASAYVENGFDVPMDGAVIPAFAVLMGFLIPCILLAGACLKFRELESK
jgi:hypothetical protein